MEVAARRQQRSRQKPALSTDHSLQSAHSLSSPVLDLNLEDLELLHQYVTSSSFATSQLPQATAQMQHTIPQLAQSHPFLMRGLLAKAAVHLSWLNASRRQHYLQLAAKHHCAALPAFRSALDGMSEANHFALIVYSKQLVWCSFAWYDASSHRDQSTLGSSGSNWLPNWLLLLRGSCLIVKACTPWISKDTYVLPSRLGDASTYHNSPDRRQLLELRSQLIAVLSPADDFVLQALEEAFALASLTHENTPLRSAMNHWVGALSNDYIAALQQGEQVPLILLAHFCVLVSRSETRWFMKGHGLALLQSINERLNDRYKQYIGWPCAEVGL